MSDRPTTRIVALSAGRAHWAAGNPGPQANIDHLMALAAASAAEAPQIIVFPEFAVTGWPYPSEQVVRATGEPVPGDGPLYRRYADLARRTGAVVCGWLAERESAAIYHNTAFLVGPDGAFLGKYRKVHPTPSEEGNWWFAPGDDIPVFDLGFAKVGMAICWDMDFPEVCRSLLLGGAEVVLHPTVANDRRDVCPVRCKENHLPMVISVYEEASYALDASGTVLADLGEGAGGYLVCDLDLGRVDWRSKYGLLHDPRQMLLARRRPGAYGALVDDSRVPSWSAVFTTTEHRPLADEDLADRFPRLARGRPEAPDAPTGGQDA